MKKPEIAKTQDEEIWDKIAKETDYYLLNEHPVGSVIGYHHNHIWEYLKKHYKSPEKK